MRPLPNWTLEALDIYKNGELKLEAFTTLDTTVEAALDIYQRNTIESNKNRELKITK